MRTTVTLDDDVAAAVEELRRREGRGLSEALNEIARRGLVSPTRRRPFVQRTYDTGEPLLDLTNVAEAIEATEGPFAR